MTATTNTVKHTPTTEELIAEVKARQKHVRDGIEDLKYRLAYMDGYEVGVRSTLPPAPQEKGR